MKRMLAVTVAALLMSASFPALRADEMASRMEAMILVKKAVAFLKEKGRGKAFEEFSNPNGRFVLQDHYIFAYEINGKCVVNAANRNMVGRTLVGISYRNSKPGTQDQAQDAKKSEIGWQYCVFTDADNKTERRMAYLEKVDDIIIGCGNLR
jgi:cytochrome c